MPSPSPSKRKQRHDAGMRAERIAAWYLRLKGYRVLALRYRNHAGEIDLVATKGKMLIAVEVKARPDYRTCAESVPPQKQQRIMRALEGLMAGHGKIAGLGQVANRNIRFDVIGMVKGVWPHHIKDAWRA